MFLQGKKSFSLTTFLFCPFLSADVKMDERAMMSVAAKMSLFKVCVCFLRLLFASHILGLVNRMLAKHPCCICLEKIKIFNELIQI